MRPLAKKTTCQIENRNCANPAFRKITLLVSYSSSCSSSKLLSRFQYRGRVRGRARVRLEYPVLVPYS
ncbi:hypothetical protein D1AOALGA4SA_11168 [Olavius algarvensis Delta 1 endosymbiont]|nr:hypothetical protein D1AOALGA4SA_11168 [Olavius algarvensis Delta 1 endosymbiont]